MEIGRSINEKSGIGEAAPEHDEAAVEDRKARFMELYRGR